MNSLDSQPGCPLPCCPRSAAQVGSRAHTKPLRVRQASRSVRLLHALSPVPPVTSPSCHQSLLSPVPPVTSPSYHQSLLSPVPPVTSPSSHQSLLSPVPPVTSPFCHQSLLSPVPPLTSSASPAPPLRIFPPGSPSLLAGVQGENWQAVSRCSPAPHSVEQGGHEWLRHFRAGAVRPPLGTGAL